MKLRLYSLLILVIWIASCSKTSEQDSIREISEGSVIGAQGENDTYVWKGIPFAEPPISDLRWKAPKDPAPWSDVLQALEFKPACFQRSSWGVEGDGDWGGSEDCLYLNVWTPELTPEEIKDSKTQLPVMMWIHGGANVVGSAHVYDPSLLVAKHKVVVVTIQYRMGPLGWFRHPALSQDGASEKDKSGNYGTLDTIKALEWINKNIGHFGGDPNNVTVFGESAGGHNTAAIFASPLAEGLYHKAIVQSGIMSTGSIDAAESFTPEDRIAPTTSGLEVFSRILIANDMASDMEEANILQSEMTDEEIRRVFYSQEASDLFEAASDSSPKRNGMTRVFPDGHVIHKGGIQESFTNSNLSRVPIITGTNKDENKFFNSLNRNFVEWGPATGLYKTAGIDEMPLAIIDPDYYEALNFYGSSFWKQRAVDTPSKQLIDSGHQNTYAYRFDWDELSTINGMDLSQLIGAAHAMEILFVFGSFDSYIIKNFLFGEGAYPAGKKLSDQIQSYWAEFAYSGSPGKGRNNDLPEWRAWSSDREKYIVLDSENDQGVYMSSVEYTQEYLLDRMSEDSRLSDQEKCEMLFGLSYGDGNGVSKEVFNSFMGGLCQDRDYSIILDMIESSEEEILEDLDNLDE